MLNLDVIERTDKPTEWYSGLTTVPKPNDNVRVCVDLTAL